MGKKYYFCEKDLIYKEDRPDFFKLLKKYFLRAIALTSFVGVFILILSFFSITPRALMLSAKKKKILQSTVSLNQKIGSLSNMLDTMRWKDDSLYRNIYELEPIPKTIRQAGSGGVIPRVKRNLKSPEEIVKVFEAIEQLKKQLNIQESSFKQIREISRRKENDLRHFPAIRPISVRDLTKQGRGFGMRFHPILKYWRWHKGIDLTAPKNTNIYAAADGIVREMRFSPSYGKVIVIDHGNNMATLYAHLYKFNVNKGQKVSRGQVIGFVGSTGLSRGYHLHYEVHLNNKPVNPINFFADDLSADEYDELVSKNH